MVEQTDNEQTLIGTTTWGVLKQWAMRPDYRTQSWFAELEPSDVATLERLRALEAAREPARVLTPAELKQEAKEKWKVSVRETFSGHQYDLMS